MCQLSWPKQTTFFYLACTNIVVIIVFLSWSRNKNLEFTNLTLSDMRTYNYEGYSRLSWATILLSRTVELALV